MEIVCLDMEGTLTPEIWERVAFDTGIEELGQTTRDIPSYEELMDMRLKIMLEKGVKLSDVQKAASALDLLPGALDFVNNLRQNFQVVILSDTFHDIAKPLMEKLGFPFLLCHNLEIRNDEIVSYKLRHSKAKKQAIESFQNMGYRCFAAGDSHNDIQMFEVATKGFFINAPENISSKYPNINSFHNYNDLEKEILLNSVFVE
jgi:phosphoserine/homoserine phosphotransferase|tara:strand:+ start:790 stop:1398 length:609 start_codon:yes stop_codon:yes gene_type:complete